MSDLFWMQKALLYAKEALACNEVPVGAVLVDNNDREIAYGYNQTIAQTDPTAHAEIIALRKAAQHIGNYRLSECTLYVTLEPCCMCAGALVQARIKRLVFGARDFRAGACGSTCNLLKGQPFNHLVDINDGILEEDCALVLTRFFQSKR